MPYSVTYEYVSPNVVTVYLISTERTLWNTFEFELASTAAEFVDGLQNTPLVVLVTLMQSNQYI